MNNLYVKSIEFRNRIRYSPNGIGEMAERSFYALIVELKKINFTDARATGELSIKKFDTTQDIWKFHFILMFYETCTDRIARRLGIHIKSYKSECVMCIHNPHGGKVIATQPENCVCMERCKCIKCILLMCSVFSRAYQNLMKMIKGFIFLAIDIFKFRSNNSVREKHCFDELL